jgi:tetratricopeptide (TPR) repeat protein
MAAFRRAIGVQPEGVTAIASLASVLAAAPDPASRKPQEAVVLAERAVALTGRRDANTLDVLAVAYAAAGNFDRALAIIDEALALDPPAGLATLLRQHRDLFAKRQFLGSSR